MKKVVWLKKRETSADISVVTDPIPFGSYRYTEAAKAHIRTARDAARKIAAPGTRVPLTTGFRGHPAVTRSLVHGLRELGLRYNYNPQSLSDLGQTVVVLSGIPALRQMILLKQRGYIRRLLVGPNILNDPTSFGGILASPEVDRHFNHMLAAGVTARFLPALASRCVPWAAGVDAEWWRPDESETRDLVLIYNKPSTGLTVPLAPYQDALLQSGQTPTVLEYGTYTQEGFRQLLRRSKLMLAFTRSESQGIAFAEAWACDVPTLIWNNSEPTYLGVAFHGSAAPYLTDATGAFFTDIEDFRGVLRRWEEGRFSFTPRAWCLEHMTDAVCARHLLAIAESI
jgi:hypothetical protein